jgi:hypothetical protein
MEAGYRGKRPNTILCMRLNRQEQGGPAMGQREEEGLGYGVGIEIEKWRGLRCGLGRKDRTYCKAELEWVGLRQRVKGVGRFLT